ncbi:hypothetical protein [Luteolibacter luteus]|uniref:Uncharacterized protein n=1 Tax=Luteolibacter luteus TaxID=2728835 RepID=A0A858RFH4_9BACT|nr:hypothetical protein [Luteolibacter luteus]QJE94883.1 hypothetical protein HHL09_03510 [Luteolibacter luteus]
MLRLLALLLFCCLPAKSQEKRIAVFVGLCDNVTQGIVKVGAKIGDGDKPDENLYWGCTDGLKSCFKASRQWKLEKSEVVTGDERILERLTFRHRTAKAVLIAEAWRGSKLKDCYIASEAAMLSGKNDLVVFIGHNVRMDHPIDSPSVKAAGKTDAMVLCCKSEEYFRDRLQDAGVRPVLLTTQLMYPGSFILRDSLEPWLVGKDHNALRDAASQAYARNQNLSGSAARGVFSCLDP